MLPGERKSVEPMAAKSSARTAAQHQSLLHFVGIAPWSDEKRSGQGARAVLPAIEKHGPIEAWIIDDTGFPKQGKHSVGGISIVGSLASRPIVRWRCRCRLPTMGQLAGGNSAVSAEGLGRG